LHVYKMYKVVLKLSLPIVYKYNITTINVQTVESFKR